MGNRQQMGLQSGEDGVSVVWVIGFRKQSLGIGKNAYKMLRNQRANDDQRGFPVVGGRQSDGNFVGIGKLNGRDQK